MEQDGYPAGQWEPGDVILERIDLPAPAGMPPGEEGIYRLRLGRFNAGTGQRLARVDASGAFAGDSLISEGIAISAGAPPDPLPRPPFPVDKPAGQKHF